MRFWIVIIKNLLHKIPKILKNYDYLTESCDSILDSKYRGLESCDSILDPKILDLESCDSGTVRIGIESLRSVKHDSVSRFCHA